MANVSSYGFLYNAVSVDIFTTKETGPLSRSGVPKKWSSAFTEAFIDCYDECLEAQELTNESKTKKDMYELISKKLKDKGIYIYKYI